MQTRTREGRGGGGGDGGEGWMGSMQVDPGEVHFRQTFPTFYNRKLPSSPREAVARSLEFLVVPLQSSFLGLPHWGRRIAHPKQVRRNVAEQWLWHQQYCATEKTNEPSSVRLSDGIPLEVHIAAVRLNEVRTGQGDKNTTRKNASCML